ncbi:AbrB/MazE/SpoVT family DNA-binding domain-containing protein [archaeon]|nr:MAG: AbrB/MazE/SpoVT family DNA-binding domain-containing protein [archaeon]
MVLSVKTKIGKRRVLVIPKKVAETLKIEEGSMVEITVKDDSLVVKPIRDAVWLSLYGKKFKHITFDELESESIEQQERYSKETQSTD